MEHVTLSSNCHDGIQVNSTSSNIEENVSVRNHSSDTFDSTPPSGGIEVKGDKNRILENEVSGNGYTFFASLPDFGIGVLGKNNVIEGNGITGNIHNGITVFLGATGNTVSRNIVMGNPPIALGVAVVMTLEDIHDFNGAGANTYVKNLCEVSGGGAAAAVRVSRILPVTRTHNAEHTVARAKTWLPRS